MTEAPGPDGPIQDPALTTPYHRPLAVSSCVSCVNMRQHSWSESTSAQSQCQQRPQQLRALRVFLRHKSQV